MSIEITAIHTHEDVRHILQGMTEDDTAWIREKGKRVARVRVVNYHNRSFIVIPHVPNGSALMDEMMKCQSLDEATDCVRDFYQVPV